MSVVPASNHLRRHPVQHEASDAEGGWQRGLRVDERRLALDADVEVGTARANRDFMDIAPCVQVRDQADPGPLETNAGKGDRCRDVGILRVIPGGSPRGAFERIAPRCLVHPDQAIACAACPARPAAACGKCTRRPVYLTNALRQEYQCHQQLLAAERGARPHHAPAAAVPCATSRRPERRSRSRQGRSPRPGLRAHAREPHYDRRTQSPSEGGIRAARAGLRVPRPCRRRDRGTAEAKLPPPLSRRAGPSNPNRESGAGSSHARVLKHCRRDPAAADHPKAFKQIDAPPPASRRTAHPHHGHI